MMADPHVPDRGRDHHLATRSAATTPSSTCAARSCTSTAGCCARSRRPTPRATSARTSSARASTSTSSCTPAPAPTSAARRRRCSTRSRAAAASRGSSRRSRPSPASTPARPWSTTSSRSPRCRRSSRNGADWFAAMGTEKSKGFGIFSLSGHVTRPGPVRGAARHHAARAARPGRRHARRPRAEVLDAGRLVDAAASPPSTSTSRSTSSRSAAAGSMLGTRALQIFDETTCVVRAVLTLDRVLQARVLRQVHAVPRGHLVARADPRPARARARAPRTDLDKLLDICDNILGRVVLRARRRRDQPDHVSSHPVLPRRVPRPPRPTAAARSTRAPPPLFAAERSACMTVDHAAAPATPSAGDAATTSSR